MRRAALALLTTAVVLGAAATPAAAHLITVGPTLNSITVEHHALCAHPGGAGTTSACMYAQDSPSLTSPVDGTIVAWRVKGAVGQVALRVLSGNTGFGGSSLETPTGTGKQVFSAEIPVASGNRFAVVLSGKGGTTGEIGRDETAGATFSAWTAQPNYEESLAPSQTGLPGRLLLNVDIQPAPTITAVSPATAPAGTTPAVTITGTDFEEVRGVTFGSDFFVPYEVVSETEIVAHPNIVVAGDEAVEVTTRGGIATAPAAFTVEPEPISVPSVPGTTSGKPGEVAPLAPVVIPPTKFPAEQAECHVPKLKSKKLSKVKPLLVKAHCKLGKVTRRKGAGTGPAKVVGELPPAGARAPANHPVAIALG